ncbi:MAG: hypothetical protein VST71_00975 [Nitrospirota bacterium]|nr:hypothetical protein [Nitrospirota bacterium]
MPNGDYTTSREEWDKIRAFFDSRAEILNKFAQKFNLYIDKYYHDTKGWCFRFRHPEGGIGGVGIYREDDATVQLVSYWQICEYDTFTMYSKWGDKKTFAINQIDLYGELEKELRNVLSWRKEELIANPGFENPWANYTKEEWQKLFPEYPLPNL